MISGGLGGLGLALAAWLAERGARRLLLTSRRGVRSGEQTCALAALRATGVQVKPCPQRIAYEHLHRLWSIRKGNVRAKQYRTHTVTNNTNLRIVFIFDSLMVLPLNLCMVR